MAGYGLSGSCVAHGSVHRFLLLVRTLDKRDRIRERGNHRLRGVAYIILYVALEMIYRGIARNFAPSSPFIIEALMRKQNMTAKEPQPRSNATAKFELVSERGVECLVDEFYRRIRVDPTLAPIFDRTIPNDGWGPHLATMRNFWSSVMLTSGRYKGNPVAKHLQIEGMEPLLFDHWMGLFTQTCRELFVDDVAAQFIVKAQRIAESLKLALFYRPDRRWPRTLS
jgi:hemoglobin